jgi:uncharacterized membrane protein
VEVCLIILGCGFTFASVSALIDLELLAGWDALAACYLVIGFVVVRRRRLRPDPIQPGGSRAQRLLTGARINFAFTLVASVVGMASAGAVLEHGKDVGYSDVIRPLGAVAIVCGWMLLHVGYARFYARCYYDPTGESGRGMDFPGSPVPIASDFLYFSFTMGTSFAASDVTVTSPPLRWHVMVHSVLSFFYNTIVLALAIGILTGRLTASSWAAQRMPLKNAADGPAVSRDVRADAGRRFPPLCACSAIICEPKL